MSLWQFDDSASDDSVFTAMNRPITKKYHRLSTITLFLSMQRIIFSIYAMPKLLMT